MKYTVEMGSSSVINMPSFMKIGSRIENLLTGDTHTHRHTDTWTHQKQGDLTRQLLFSLIMEVN
jgi:hypothetical protein